MLLEHMLPSYTSDLISDANKNLHTEQGGYSGTADPSMVMSEEEIESFQHGNLIYIFCKNAIRNAIWNLFHYTTVALEFLSFYLCIELFSRNVEYLSFTTETTGWNWKMFVGSICLFLTIYFLTYICIYGTIYLLNFSCLWIMYDPTRISLYSKEELILVADTLLAKSGDIKGMQHLREFLKENLN